ncbi:MAG: NAD(P)-binding domain-containing protein [Acidimicrobiales bacterium]
MGANLVRRLALADIECVVYDRDEASVATLVDEGVAIGASSVEDLVGKLEVLGPCG